MAGVRVDATIAIRHALGELTEQDREQHRAYRDDGENRDTHGARSREDRGHREHTGTNDAADDQCRGGGESQGVGLLLVAIRQRFGFGFGFRGGWRNK